MAILSPAKRSGSLCTRVVWTPVHSGQLEKTSSLQGFDHTETTQLTRQCRGAGFKHWSIKPRFNWGDLVITVKD